MVSENTLGTEVIRFVAFQRLISRLDRDGAEPPISLRKVYSEVASITSAISLSQ